MMNPMRPRAVISLHIPSMQQSAQLVSAVLKEAGYDVWMCCDSFGEYREEIDDKITKADVVVMLLNNHWVNSIECKREFTVAQQAHFTNREINGSNTPILLPLAFSDFNWFTDHPLFSVKNTNFICHDSENLLSGKYQETILKLKEAATLSLYQLVVPPASSGSAPSSLDSQGNFGSLDMNMNNLYGSTEVIDSSAAVRSDNKFYGSKGVSGDGEAEFAEAMKYENGTEGVTKDMFRAASLFAKAASCGHLEATYKLAVCYDFGEGVEEDEERAYELYQKASSRGHLNSTFNLGVCYASGSGVKKDEAKAAQLYGKAASQGHVNSIYNLGGCYKKGKGVKQDTQRAVDLYQRAADLGHMKAACNLGSSYTTGDGVKKDNKKAIILYEKASAQGVSEATYNLALCFEQGRGVKKDKKKAVKLYETASSQGHVNAICRLGYCFSNGKGVEKDAKRGSDLYEKAATQGSLYGAYHLGLCYEKGTGRTKDVEKAKELYSKAAAKGDSSSRKRLHVLSFKKQTEKFIAFNSPPVSRR